MASEVDHPLKLTLHRPTQVGEPVYELAEKFFPRQGDWTVSRFLDLPDNRGIELVDGRLEFLPMPSHLHQRVPKFFFLLLNSILDAAGGEALFSGMKVQMVNRNMRDPDVVGVLGDHSPADDDRYWAGADIAVEVVSPDGERRDYEEKRLEYAQVGIREYWIVDPQRRQILLLSLAGGSYREVGTFSGDQTAESTLLPELKVKPNDVWAAAKMDSESAE